MILQETVHTFNYGYKDQFVELECEF